LVEAGIIGFMGMATLILPEGPCYRCLYPEMPDRAPTCSQAGVLGNNREYPS